MTLSDTRATGSFSMSIAAKTKSLAESSFSLAAGETVTIKASYIPFDASVDFGLVDSDGVFHYFNITDGSIDKTIMASATLVFTDVWGVDNILHQVYGSWSGDEDDTKNRWVVYYSYNKDDVMTDSVPDYTAPQSFHYEPTGFKGLTFKVKTGAVIVSTGNNLYLTVSTDPYV